MSSLKIALTLDDLPVHGDKTTQYSRLDIAQNFTNAFQNCQLPPVTGFVNMKAAFDFPDGKAVIDLWSKTGNRVGNHTFSHLDLAHVSEGEFIVDIKENQKQLETVALNQSEKYFRYPFLSEGNCFMKRTFIREYLSSQHYIIAPVTIDFHDFMWNTALTKCLTHQESNGVEYLKNTFIMAAISVMEQSVLIAKELFSADIHHIMLLHAGLATSLFIEPLIQRLSQRGVQFISLEEALTDKVYEKDFYIPERNGLNFLQQAAAAYQMPIRLCSDLFRKQIARFAYNLPSTISL